MVLRYSTARRGAPVDGVAEPVDGIVRRPVELVPAGRVHLLGLGTFSGRYDPDTVAMLAVSAADGMGIPLSLGDPEITARGAVHDVLAALRELLRL
jgi:hypothetical protein